MIVGVAVCPGAPFLVEGTATAIARTVPDLLKACDKAVDQLPPADRSVVIGSGSVRSGRTGGDPTGLETNRPWRTFPPGTAVRTSVTRSDLAIPDVIRLPGGGRPADDPDDVGPVAAGASTPLSPSVATLVGAHLLCVAGHRTPSWALEVIGPDTAGLAASLPTEFDTTGPDRISLLVIADGAACHGDNAPGRRDDRSGAFDAAVANALAGGDPVALREACRNPDLPPDAVMASVGPLALLAELTNAAPPDTAELLYADAPFGVGYFVASWQWIAA